MNQQETLRLLLQFLEYDGTTEEAFTAAINEATAQARREALEGAAQVARIHSQYPIENDYDRGFDAGCKRCYKAIRALAAQPQEGM
jgi:hypothetical protein